MASSGDQRSCRCRHRPAAGAACARARHVGVDLGERLSLAAVSGRAGRRATASRSRPSPAGCRRGAPGRRGAHQRQRELLGEQLVIGEACGAARRAMRPRRPGAWTARSASAKPGQPSRRSRAGPATRGRSGRRSERRRHGGRARARLRSFGQRLERLDSGTVGEPLGRDDAVGMDDLPFVAWKRPSCPLTTRSSPAGNAARRQAGAAGRRPDGRSRPDASADLCRAGRPGPRALVHLDAQLQRDPGPRTLAKPARRRRSAAPVGRCHSRSMIRASGLAGAASAARAGRRAGPDAAQRDAGASERAASRRPTAAAPCRAAPL